jgi:hypothetical protein
MFVQLAIVQRRAPRSKNGQRIRIPLGVMLQQTRNGRKRNRGSLIDENFGWNFLSPRFSQSKFPIDVRLLLTMSVFRSRPENMIMRKEYSQSALQR